MKKTENLRKEIEAIKKNQMEIIELKKTINRSFKTPWMESIVETTEDRISELEDRPRKFTLSEKMY